MWIFSQLFTPWGSFPPALDAKVTIAAILDNRGGPSGREFAFRYSADHKRSAWFPLFNAHETLLRLRTIDARNRVHKLLVGEEQPIGPALRQIRKIEDATPILKLEQRLAGSSFDFISYRLRDGTRAACRASRSLVLGGNAIFWDRWSLPRRVAERRERVSDPVLDRFISERIKASATVWAIESPTYAEEGTYSEKEKLAAEQLGKLRYWSDSSGY